MASNPDVYSIHPSTYAKLLRDLELRPSVSETRTNYYLDVVDKGALRKIDGVFVVDSSKDAHRRLLDGFEDAIDRVRESHGLTPISKVPLNAAPHSARKRCLLLDSEVRISNPRRLHSSFITSGLSRYAEDPSVLHGVLTLEEFESRKKPREVYDLTGISDSEEDAQSDDEVIFVPNSLPVSSSVSSSYVRLPKRRIN